jgi:hypothetical protein
MKTTIDLPDELFVAAKKKAAEERRSLRDLVASGLREQVRPSFRRARVASPIRWVTVKGGVPKGIDVSDREKMHTALRAGR